MSKIGALPIRPTFHRFIRRHDPVPRLLMSSLLPRMVSVGNGWPSFVVRPGLVIRGLGAQGRRLITLSPSWHGPFHRDGPAPFTVGPAPFTVGPAPFTVGPALFTVGPTPSPSAQTLSPSWPGSSGPSGTPRASIRWPPTRRARTDFPKHKSCIRTLGPRCTSHRARMATSGPPTPGKSTISHRNPREIHRIKRLTAARQRR
jgi:hypothetical protein